MLLLIFLKLNFSYGLISGQLIQAFVLTAGKFSTKEIFMKVRNLPLLITLHIQQYTTNKRLIGSINMSELQKHETLINCEKFYKAVEIK